MSVNDEIVVSYYRGSCKYDGLRISTDAFLTGNLSSVLDEKIDTGCSKQDVQIKFAFERKMDLVFDQYFELVDDTILSIENALNNDEHDTKAAQKRITDDVNRVLAFFITDRIFGGSEAYGWQRSDFLKAVQLPYDIRLHNVPSAIKKLEKYIKANSSVSTLDASSANQKVYFASLILRAFSENGLGQLIELANDSKSLPIRQRNAAKKYDYNTLYSGLIEASKVVVDKVMSTLTEHYESRCKDDLLKLSELSLQYKDELNVIHSTVTEHREIYKQVKALNMKYIEQVGESNASVLRASPDHIAIHLGKAKREELEKVRLNLVKWLATLEVVHVQLLKMDIGLDGLDCSIDLYRSNTIARTLNFKTIYAGGHNIQRLHLRTVHHLDDEREVEPF